MIIQTPRRINRALRLGENPFPISARRMQIMFSEIDLEVVSKLLSH